MSTLCSAVNETSDSETSSLWSGDSLRTNSSFENTAFELQHGSHSGTWQWIKWLESLFYSILWKPASMDNRVRHLNLTAALLLPASQSCVVIVTCFWDFYKRPKNHVRDHCSFLRCCKYQKESFNYSTKSHSFFVALAFFIGVPDLLVEESLCAGDKICVTSLVYIAQRIRLLFRNGFYIFHMHQPKVLHFHPNGFTHYSVRDGYNAAAINSMQSFSVLYSKNHFFPLHLYGRRVTVFTSSSEDERAFSFKKLLRIPTPLLHEIDDGVMHFSEVDVDKCEEILPLFGQVDPCLTVWYQSAIMVVIGFQSHRRQWNQSHNVKDFGLFMQWCAFSYRSYTHDATVCSFFACLGYLLRVSLEILNVTFDTRQVINEYSVLVLAICLKDILRDGIFIFHCSPMKVFHISQSGVCKYNFCYGYSMAQRRPRSVSILYSNYHCFPFLIEDNLRIADYDSENFFSLLKNVSQAESEAASAEILAWFHIDSDSMHGHR